MGLENQFLVFLRVAILHRFYCTTNIYDISIPLGLVAQSVTCLTADMCLTADPLVASSIPARSHTFVEIDREIVSMAILLPSLRCFKKGYCQL